MINLTDKVLRPQLWYLAHLLDYPYEGFAAELAAVCEVISSLCPVEVGDHLDAFAVDALQLTIDELEEIHTRMFSLAPVCPPYVGLQIFGENNYKRGDFIACLAKDLEAYGIDVHPELPDHVGSMLRLAACQSPEEFEEMLTWCFCGAVEKMAETLALTDSPYRHLFSAISLILNNEIMGAHADA